MHLGHRDVGIPIGYWPLGGVGLVSDSGETISWWKNERRALAVNIESRIVLPRPPGVVDRLLRRSNRRRQRDDRSDVQLAIGPAVLSVSNPFRERIVNGRMTERAGNPESRQIVPSIDRGHSALESDHYIQLEKSDSRRGIVEIDLAS